MEFINTREIELAQKREREIAQDIERETRRETKKKRLAREEETAEETAEKTAEETAEKIKIATESIRNISNRQRLIETCSLSPGCTELVEYYIESLKLF